MRYCLRPLRSFIALFTAVGASARTWCLNLVRRRTLPRLRHRSIHGLQSCQCCHVAIVTWSLELPPAPQRGSWLSIRTRQAGAW